MNVIDHRTEDERMAPLEFSPSPHEVAAAREYQAQIDRQRRDRNEIDRCMAEKLQRPLREQWLANHEDLAKFRHPCKPWQGMAVL